MTKSRPHDRGITVYYTTDHQGTLVQPNQMQPSVNHHHFDVVKSFAQSGIVLDAQVLEEEEGEMVKIAQPALGAPEPALETQKMVISPMDENQRFIAALKQEMTAETITEPALGLPEPNLQVPESALGSALQAPDAVMVEVPSHKSFPVAKSGFNGFSALLEASSLALNTAKLESEEAPPASPELQSPASTKPETSLTCFVCNATCGTHTELKSHMSSCHGISRPYRCSHCAKTFAYPNVVKRHERSHTGERPYKCK